MVQMDCIAQKVKDFEIDLEKGINVSVEDQRKDTVSGVKEQAKELFSEKLEEGNSNVDVMEKKVVKEKRKKGSNKKSPKPPRPPRGPSLDPCDQKLIKEITEIAMLKRARVERMKALKKSKGTKASSSVSSVFAMVFTVLFFIVILLQGMSSSSVTSENLPAETPESGLIAVQYSGNPSSVDPNYVKSIAGFDSPGNLRTAA